MQAGSVITRPRIFTFAVVIGAISTVVQAASDADINKLTSYAVILGRAANGGLSLRDLATRGQQTHVPIFMAGVCDNADLLRQEI